MEICCAGKMSHWVDISHLGDWWSSSCVFSKILSESQQHLQPLLLLWFDCHHWLPTLYGSRHSLKSTCYSDILNVTFIYLHLYAHNQKQLKFFQHFSGSLYVLIISQEHIIICLLQMDYNVWCEELFIWKYPVMTIIRWDFCNHVLLTTIHLRTYLYHQQQ